jgi:hypothetical protein
MHSALCAMLAVLLGFSHSLSRYHIKLHQLTTRVELFYFAPRNFVIAPGLRIFNRGRDYFTEACPVQCKAYFTGASFGERAKRI